MSEQYFLEVSGLGGDVRARGFEGAFDVTRFTFEGANNGSFLGAGVTDFGPLTVTLDDETGLTAFLALVAGGQHTPLASLIVTQTGGDGLQEVYRVNLADVRVIGVREGDGDGYAVTLDYDQIGVIAQTQKPNGASGVPQTFGFDEETHAIIAPPADAAPGAAVNGAGNGTHYFLLIDGIDGGSTDEDHVGWFDLSQFEFDAMALAGGGGGGSVTEFGLLDLHLDNLAGITTLLAKLAAGQTIKGLRIEGVTGDGQTVYRLDAADLLVRQVSDTLDVGHRAGLEFGRIKLATFAQAADGALEPPNIFAWNTLTHASDIGVLPTIAPANAGGVASGEGADLFLEVTGLGGDATQEGYEGAFQVLTYAFASQNSLTLAQLAGGGAGAADFGPLTIALANETGLTEFLARAAGGLHIPAVSLIAAVGADGLEEVYRINLGDVVVTGVEEAGADGFVLTLAYSQIGVIAQTQDETGGFGTALTFGFDTTTGAPIAPPPDAVPGQGADGAGNGTHYFLLIDGVDGGSAAIGHEGWFDLSQFDFGDALVAAVAGGSAGKPAFGPLNVDLADESGLTALLLRLATGQPTAGLRIEGLTNDGDTVYRLDLADVVVTAVRETDLEGYRASFDYARIKLATFAQEPDGSLGPPQVFAWNRVDNTSDVEPLPTLSAGSGVGGLGQGDTFFLEVTGLSGGSAAEDFQGAFDVSSFAFSIVNPTSLGSAGGGAGAGKVTFSPLTLTFPDETGLTEFLALVSSGEVLSRVSLIGANSGGDGLQEVYRANLGVVVVTDVIETGSDGYRVTLEYAVIGVVQQTQNPDGSAGTPQTFGNVSDAVPAGAGDPLGNGSQYFMLIDGILGDSNEIHHVGWFELPDFALDVAKLLASGGSGSGVVDFDPLLTFLEGGGGFTGVLTKLANGQIIKGVRIEGVTNGGNTVYRLDLADVVVRHVRDDDGAGFRTSFEFGRIRLQLFPQEPDGSLGPPETFTWNLITGTSDIGTLPVIAPNHPPTAGPDSGVVNEDASRVFSWAELFSNDADVDVGDPLTITSVQAGRGSVVLDSVAKTVTYFADHDDFDLLVTGGSPDTDSFTYTLTDKAGATATASVTMTVNGVADGVNFPPFGGGPDNVVLTPGDDTASTGNGNDTVFGGAGADVVRAGAGDDQIDGGDGHDNLVGENGNDQLFGGAGKDTLQGDAGNDTLTGGSGNDLMTGGSGNERFVFVNMGGAPTEVDIVTDFRSTGDDRIVLQGGLTVTTSQILDFDHTGPPDTVITLSNGQTVVLAGYTGPLAGFVI